MTTRYGTKTTLTPVTSRAQGQDAVTDEGLPAFAMKPIEALRMFVCMGVTGNSFYVDKATRLDMAKEVIDAALRTAPLRFEALRMLADVARTNSAASNEESIYVLAKLTAKSTSMWRLPRGLDAYMGILRTGTHFLTFITYLKAEAGSFGRSLRSLIETILKTKGAEWFDFQSAKYPSRNGMSWVDVLRLTHPDLSSNADLARVGRYLIDTHKGKSMRYKAPEQHTRRNGAMAASLEKQIEYAAKGFPQEFFPTEVRNNPDFRRAMIPLMPPHALLRETRNLLGYGVLAPKSEARKIYIARMSDTDKLIEKRVHPVDIYKTWVAIRGKDTELEGVLEAATFAALPVLGVPDGNTIIGLDISGSMSWGESQVGLRVMPLEVAAFLGLAFYRQFGADVALFSSTTNFVRPEASHGLGNFMRKIREFPMASTDLSSLYVAAKKIGKRYSNVMVVTDNDINTGSSVASAMRDFEQYVGHAVKTAVLTTQPIGFQLFSPNDENSMQIAGFDTGAMRVVGNLFGCDVETAEVEAD